VEIVLIKTIHILSVALVIGIVAVGLILRLQKAEPESRAWLEGMLFRLEGRTVLPALVVLPATGMWLVHANKIPWTSPWVQAGMLGFLATLSTWFYGRMATHAGEPSRIRLFTFHALAGICAAFTVWVMTAKWP